MYHARRIGRVQEAAQPNYSNINNRFVSPESPRWQPARYILLAQLLAPPHHLHVFRRTLTKDIALGQVIRMTECEIYRPNVSGNSGKFRGHHT
jgi:hypothetical protein